MSPQPENSQLTQSTSEYSSTERGILLRIAHQSIESRFAGGELPLDIPSSHLAEPRGVFTTVYVHGDLKGCVGYPLPIAPLYRAVAETAQSAAFEDSRFRPLTMEQLPALTVSLSVLSPLLPIAAEDVEVGRHGLLIELHGYRGLLLPQVPVEHGWDRVTFLEQTCRKAGLPLDAWQRGAQLRAFTAEIFGDCELG
jgi:AmmeMemoRadiSam system protein A